jgi:hypothetical protein
VLVLAEIIGKWETDKTANLYPGQWYADRSTKPTDARLEPAGVSGEGVFWIVGICSWGTPAG